VIRKMEKYEMMRMMKKIEDELRDSWKVRKQGEEKGFLNPVSLNTSHSQSHHYHSPSSVNSCMTRD